MKVLRLIPLLFLFSFCRQQRESKKEANIIYRIGFEYIELSFDESGQAKAKTGRSNSIGEDKFLAESTTDSTTFFIKNSPLFFRKLERLREKQVESAKGYSRTQILLNDSLYFDTKMYSADFWDIYSIISDGIPIDFNPFKTRKFE
ncbi:hypothetical protein [Sphingobacterium athyrii]|uniref:Uncharacterized protein n=1 Tax=Sphingobacterium athyrii TaxID=2152717 RepID=A0A363NJX5_9SPHI|nr:hypothetical protein [Sphingobacterium athyrii]PUV21083.1 hypothetical protein DCO56_28895 [Sphingobacterium athyrii]